MISNSHAYQSHLDPIMRPESTVDPITTQVVRYKLEGIANEMEQTLLRSSYSPIVKEGMDASASLFTIKGETLAQACAVPIHLATLVPVVAKFLEVFPVATMRAGDVYIMNEPYLGGTHLPDIALVSPVILSGKVLAFAATMTHHQDVGGMTPGSIPTNATEIFQEGLRIPPLKYMDAGEVNKTLLEILRLNVRVPDMLIGDLNAQIAACRLGERRLADLALTYGAATLGNTFETLLDLSENLTCMRLSQIPKGTYAAVDFLDNDGVVLNRRVRIEVSVTVDDGRFHVDFSGTDPQLAGPFNVVESGCLAAAFYAVRALTGDDIPTNAGCFRAVTLHRPEGTLVNPVSPAPVGSRTATIKRITGCILSAFGAAMPDAVPADGANVLFALTFGGNTSAGRSFVVGEIIVGGSGASLCADGTDVIETDASNCMNQPVESLEMEAPIMVHRLELREDSGGPGKRRGGLGLVKEFEFLADITFTHRGERHYSHAAGSHGGLPGAAARSTWHKACGDELEIPSKAVLNVQRGDRVIVQTPGGGGYGHPGQRSREALQCDVADGKVSRDAAGKFYGWQT
jgi:N-methylhydantoinase B